MVAKSESLRVASLLLTIMVGVTTCSGNEAVLKRSARKRWEATDQGRVVFTYFGTRDGVIDGRVCLWDLFTGQLRLLTDQSECKATQTGPQWSPDGKHVYYCGSYPNEGLFCLNVATGECRRIRETNLDAASQWDDITYFEEGLDVPLTMDYVRGSFAYGYFKLSMDDSTGTLLAIRHIIQRPRQDSSLHIIDSLSKLGLSVPKSVSLGLFDSKSVNDVVVVESSGVQTYVCSAIPPLEQLVPDSLPGHSGSVERSKPAEFARWSGLSQRPGGSDIAISNNGHLWIYDRATGECSIPEAPPGVKISYPTFSPDGRWLAAVGWKRGFSALLVAEAQEYRHFEVLRDMSSDVIGHLCWSPDSEWILVSYRTSPGLFWCNSLKVIERATGEEVTLAPPRFSDGRTSEHMQIRGGFDWTR